MYSGVPVGSCQLNSCRGYRHKWVVSGSQRKQARLCVVRAGSGRKLQVVFVTTEVAPWCKVGGLGDVMAALPAALAAKGHRVMTVSPMYSNYSDVRDTGVRVPVRLPTDIQQRFAQQQANVSEQQAELQDQVPSQAGQQNKLQQDKSTVMTVAADPPAVDKVAQADDQAEAALTDVAASQKGMSTASSNTGNSLKVQKGCADAGHARYYMCCSAGVDRVFVDHPLYHGASGRGGVRPWPAAVISSYTHPGAVAAGRPTPDLAAAASVLCQAALAAPLLLWGTTGGLNKGAQQLDEQQLDEQQQEMQLLMDLLGLDKSGAAVGAGLCSDSMSTGNSVEVLLAAAAADQQAKLALHLRHPQQVVSGLAAPVLLGTAGSEVDCRWQVSDLLMQHRRQEANRADDALSGAAAEAPLVFVANDWPCGLLPLWLEVYRDKARQWQQHNPHVTWLKQQQEQLFQQVQVGAQQEVRTARPSVQTVNGHHTADLDDIAGNSCSGLDVDQQQTLQELQRAWQQKHDDSFQQQEYHQVLPAENKAPDPSVTQGNSQDSSSSWSAAADAWLQDVGYDPGSVYDAELAAAVDEVVAAGAVPEEQVQELRDVQYQVEQMVQQEQVLGEAIERLRTATMELDASEQQPMKAADTPSNSPTTEGHTASTSSTWSSAVLSYEQHLTLLHEMLGQQLAESKVVFAIHNFGYQGTFQGKDHFDRLGLPERMLSSFVSPVIQRTAEAGRAAARVAAAAASAVGSQLAALVGALQRVGNGVQGSTAGLLASVQQALLQEKKEEILQQQAAQPRVQSMSQRHQQPAQEFAAGHLQQVNDSSTVDSDVVILNWLRAGLSASDLAITVSSGYAQEMLTGSWAATGTHHSSSDSMAELLGSKQLRGILNGLDTRCWDPSRDPLLPAAVRYSPDTVATGKAAAKQLLQRRLGLTLDASVPVIAFVGRLTPQKGVDVVLAAVPQLMTRGAAAGTERGQQQQQQQLVLTPSRLPSSVKAGSTTQGPASTTVVSRVQQEQQPNGCAAGGAQLVMLGTGERWMEEVLLQLSSKYPGRAVGVPDFNEPLAHLIMAAADLLLVPSRFEPCGLVALAGLRYGAVPVASITGGLADIISSDVGYAIPNPGPEGDTASFRKGVVGLVQGVQQALLDYGTSMFSRKQRAAMAVDVSWEAPCAAWEQALMELVDGDAAAEADTRTGAVQKSSICSAR